MGTVVSFKSSLAVAPPPSTVESGKTAVIIQDILTYLLGQAEAAELPATAHALALAIHCAGKEAAEIDRV
jgi:hypothetical protein